jgi:K+-sensing histidine kinase KdpD
MPKNTLPRYIRSADNLTFVAEPISANLIGDSILLKFLLENLLNEALDSEGDGKLILRAKDDGDFVRFDFIDTRRSFTQEELNKLFYPQRERMNYLICRQIIREHDEYAGKRGCRINAEPAAEGGFSIYFTLTKKQ